VCDKIILNFRGPFCMRTDRQMGRVVLIECIFLYARLDFSGCITGLVT
jgi:hypothetical protein